MVKKADSNNEAVKFFNGNFFSLFFLVAPSFADEKIICKVKGVGQRIFLLDSGIFSSKVLVKKPKGEFVDWCPETESQKPSFGRGTAICKLSGVRLQNKLVWGETVIDFDNPSWKEGIDLLNWANRGNSPNLGKGNCFLQTSLTAKICE